MAKQQKKRAPKTSKGTHGAGGKGRALTSTELILMGKGIFRTTKVLGHQSYRGAVGIEPFDKKQAKLNRELYPHLFSHYGD